MLIEVQNIPVTSMETDESSAESDVKKFKTEGTAE